MEIEKTKSNIIVIAALLAFIIGATAVTFFILRPAQVPENIFICQKQQVPFRANISSCLAFDVSPSREVLGDAVSTPTAGRVAILMDPNSSGAVGLAAYDIYKIYKSLEPQTNIAPGIAYTYHWPEQPLVPNTTIESATFNSPIIWLQLNQSESKIVVDGAKIYVYARTSADLDAAACLISIELINRTLGCSE